MKFATQISPLLNLSYYILQILPSQFLLEIMFSNQDNYNYLAAQFHQNHPAEQNIKNINFCMKNNKEISLL